MRGSLITHDVMLLRTAESRRGLVTLTGYLQGQNKRVKNKQQEKAVNLNPPECFNRPNLIKKSGGFPSWRHHGGEVTGVWGRLSSRFPFPTEAHRWRPRSEGNPVIKQRHPQHVTLPTALSPSPNKDNCPITSGSANLCGKFQRGGAAGNRTPKRRPPYWKRRAKAVIVSCCSSCSSSILAHVEREKFEHTQTPFSTLPFPPASTSLERPKSNRNVVQCSDFVPFDNNLPTLLSKTTREP